MYIFGIERLVREVRSEVAKMGLETFDCSIKEKNIPLPHRGFVVTVPDAKMFIHLVELAYMCNLDKVWFLGRNLKMKEVNTDTMVGVVLFKANLTEYRPLTPNPQYVYLNLPKKYFTEDI